jgi:ribosome-associated toxin RatA of RatAB toxin-antitoxin module
VPGVYRSALMPYSAQTMFEIVNNVAAYPEFLPWCAETRILTQTESTMEASILMKKAGLNHWFTTRNTIDKNKSIKMTLVNGPFKQLDGEWKFTEFDPDASKIELDLNFEFSGGLGTTLIAPIFTQIANTLVDSFCKRAQNLN